MAKLTKSEKIAIKERLRELIDAKFKKFGRHKNIDILFCSIVRPKNLT
jgi:hypothetical protein